MSAGRNVAIASAGFGTSKHQRFHVAQAVPIARPSSPEFNTNMAKKYLSLEEAAAQLGMKVDDLKRLRESGDIRGFADRGTWKFKPEDVEELARSRQADSDPSVPILGADDDEPLVSLSGEGSSVILSDEEDDVGQQPTIIRKAGEGLSGLSASDSDVRLVLDDSLTEDSTPDVTVPKKKESDSDVRLVDDAAKPDDSDSDVKLVADGSDSDVQLVDPAGAGKAEDDSDSDVQLVGDRSHSDIVLEAPSTEAGSDSDIKLIGSDVGTEKEVPLVAADSGKSPALPDSGISLEAADSGIALEGADDSGISLLEEDSGISLAADDVDSGIALGSPTDSGIALEALAAADSKKGKPRPDLDETQFEFEAMGGDSEFELASSKPTSGAGSDTGVIVFDDDAVDEHSPTMVKSSSAAAAGFTAGETFEFDDGLEVAEDVIGEDDELDDVDVFDAGDEDFAQSFAAGESHAEFIAAPGVIVAPVQQEWGTAMFVGMLLTTVVMLLCAVVMFDFVRSMWSYSEPTGFTSMLMSELGGMFKK
jgi:Helix-turn-helix domain